MVCKGLDDAMLPLVTVLSKVREPFYLREQVGLEEPESGVAISVWGLTNSSAVIECLRAVLLEWESKLSADFIVDFYIDHHREHQPSIFSNDYEIAFLDV